MVAVRVLVVLSLSLVMSVAMAGNRKRPKPEVPVPPNVIIVMTDDQGYGDLSAHGNPVLKTPNLDQLASQSIRLTDFHVAPMCTPTRGQLMSGRHALANGAMNVGSGTGDSAQDDSNHGQFLRRCRLPHGPLRKMASRGQLPLPTPGSRLPGDADISIVSPEHGSGLLEQRLLRRFLSP